MYNTKRREAKLMYTVYGIVNSEKVLYVGKTVNMQRRKYEHTYRRRLDKSYSFITIETGLTKEEAKVSEERYIQYYGTFDNGWNITAGEGTRRVETKHGDGRFVEGNRLSDRRKRKPVLCVETNETFTSVKECASKMGINEFGIYKVCDGINKTYKKYRFQYI